MKLNCILLIDDDKICNYLHEKIIRRLNITHKIKTAYNGSEAIHLVNEHLLSDHHPPDIIFIDLKMPVMDGFEFLKKLKEFHPDIFNKATLVILTTSAHPNDLKKISGMKRLEVITKPLTEDKLKGILQMHFSKIETEIGTQ